MTSTSKPFNALATLSALFEGYTFLKRIHLMHNFEGKNVFRAVYFFIDRSKPLDDPYRVKMAFLVNLGIHELHGATVMQAFKSSVFMGHQWIMDNGEIFKKAPKQNHEESPYCYFLGRAKSLYIAMQQMMAFKGDLAQDAILYQPKSGFPIKLANRAHVLLLDLYDFKGMTPASHDLQMALDGLKDAVLSLRNSTTAPTKTQEKEWRGRASSGFLVAFLMLKRLHDNSLKGV